MSSDWLVAAYALDGTPLGWSTRLTSIVQLSRKAERFSDRDSAAKRIPVLERSWRGHHHLWCAERAPLQDTDIRVENGEIAPPPLDGDPVHMPRSSVPADQNDSRKGGVVSTKQKQPQPSASKSTKPKKSKPKPATTAKPAASSPPTKLLPAKPVMRTTAAKAMESQPVSEGQPNGLCICGCGEKATAYLKRGHYSKLSSKLEAIARGELDSIKAFGKRLAAAWGPWVPSKLGGVKPQFVKSGKGLLEYWKGGR